MIMMMLRMLMMTVSIIWLASPPSRTLTDESGVSMNACVQYLDDYDDGGDGDDGDDNDDNDDEDKDGQFCTTGPNISLGGIWVGWSFRK